MVDLDITVRLSTCLLPIPSPYMSIAPKGCPLHKSFCYSLFHHSLGILCSLPTKFLQSSPTLLIHFIGGLIALPPAGYWSVCPEEAVLEPEGDSVLPQLPQCHFGGGGHYTTGGGEQDGAAHGQVQGGAGAAHLTGVFFGFLFIFVKRNSWVAMLALPRGLRILEFLISARSRFLGFHHQFCLVLMEGDYLPLYGVHFLNVVKGSTTFTVIFSYKREPCTSYHKLIVFHLIQNGGSVVQW